MFIGLLVEFMMRIRLSAANSNRYERRLSILESQFVAQSDPDQALEQQIDLLIKEPIKEIPTTLKC